MNILFFLTPKAEVVWVQDTYTLRQTLEKIGRYRYTSVPVLNKEGEYVGTLTEGDLLWSLYARKGTVTDDMLEQTPITTVARKADYKCVRADTDMQDLLNVAAAQNFVPVIDDKNSFIGIVTRSAIMQYCLNEMEKEEAQEPAHSRQGVPVR